MAKSSRFRHTKANLAKPDQHFLNVSATGAIWDCANFMAANSLYLAVPWQQFGSTAIFRHDQFGKAESNPPILTGHTGHVIDLAFNPFDDSMIFTASEDATIRGWKIPAGGLKANIATPVVELKEHSKKVGILSFHPSASNVLASAGADQTVFIYDIEKGKSGVQVKGFQEQLLSLNWNLDGSLFNTTTKDKKLSVVDSRSGQIVASSVAHQGSKTFRSVWAKRRDLIVTTGFDKKQHRELMVWDCRSMATPLHTEEIDQQSSVLMPLFDEDTNMLYLGGKGDGSIRYYEVWRETVPIVACNTYTSSDPQKGLCMVPKTLLDTRQCEVARMYKLGTKTIVPIHFILPRKQSEMEFQEDVYPPTFAATPALSAAEFFNGKNSVPNETDLRGLFDKTPLVTREGATPSSPTSSSPVLPKEEHKKEEAAAAPARPLSPTTRPIGSAGRISPRGGAGRQLSPRPVRQASQQDDSDAALADAIRRITQLEAIVKDQAERLERLERLEAQASSSAAPAQAEAKAEDA